MDPVPVHAMPTTAATTTTTTTTTNEHLDFNFSFPSLNKTREPFDLSIFSASTSSSSSSMAPLTNLNFPDDDDDDFGDFESVPAISTLAMPSGFSTFNPTQNFHGSSSGMLGSFSVSSNNGDRIGEGLDIFGHFTSVESISSSKNAHFPGANVDLFSDFTASVSDSSSLQMKNGSSKLDASKAKSWDMDSEFHIKKPFSQSIFGDFTSPPISKVTPMVVAPIVNVTTVQEDFFPQFPDSSDQAINESNHFDGSNESLLKISLDDDWGDFVEYSNPASTDITQRSVEDIVLNATALLVDSNLRESKDITSSPFAKTESLNGDSRGDMFIGLNFFDRDSFPHVKVNNTVLPGQFDADDLKGKAKTASKASGLQRTLSENLTNEMRKGSSIDISAPIPLSLFGEEELEVEGIKDEPVQPVMSRFQGHSRIKALSIGSLPSGSAANFSQMIASLYPVAQPEFPQDDVFQTSNDDIKQEPNSKEKKTTGTFDGVDNNHNSSEGVRCNHNLEIYLFDLNLAPPSKKTLVQYDICATEEFSEEATTASLLLSASANEQYCYVKAWADVLAVCAAELKHAEDIWNQAQKEGVQQDFLAKIEAKRYFAAIGQIYVVSLILASTSNVCKSWLKSSKESQGLLASLRHCKDTWLQTNLKEAVQFSLDALKGSLPTSLVSWNGIENFPSAAQKVCTEAPDYSDPICRLSLLPLLPFTDTGLSTIQWSGSTYFLPLANVWAKYVSDQAPTMSSIQLKSR